MNQLKILLQSNIFYIVSLIILVIYILLITIVKKYNSIYDLDTTNIRCEVNSYEVDDMHLKIICENEEKIIVNYYNDFDTTNFIGATININGNIKEIINNTIPNTFNYKKYLYNNKIYYTFNADDISLINYSNNVIDKIKNNLIEKLNSYESSTYMKLFILGDKTDLSDNMYEIYQTNGISHLLAISGLHIGIFIIILEKLLKRVNNNIKFIIISLYLLFYLSLTNYLISLFRCVVFYLLKKINKLIRFNISNLKLLFLTAFILVLINPFNIYSISFRYSLIITFFILILNTNNSNYIKSLFLISIISFLSSLPISINMNYEINIFSIILNMIFVPYVSFILYPFSLLVFLFPFFENIFIILINLFEYMNTLFNNLFSYKIIIPRLPIYIVIIYYITLYIIVIKKFKYSFINLLIILLFKYLTFIDFNYYVYYLDVGQGDSILLVSPFKDNVILIDAGGNFYYDVSDNTITLLKSLGINTIDILVLTHGDMDHAKDADNIIDNLNVSNIMFNNNKYNDLEINILKNNINMIEEVNLKYFKSINYNYYTVDDENDSSIILSFDIYGNNFLFTGDVGTSILENVINKYNLKTDFFKVSHHGSKNNTSNDIICNLKPKYAFISAGRNNRFNHPNEEVLNILNNNDILTFTTASNGSIEVKINKNKYDIITFNP